MRRKVTAALAALAASAVSTQPANSANYASEYSVTAFGLRIASTRFESTIDDRSYSINASMRARGVARLFTTTAGTLNASGDIGGGAQSSSFDVRYTDNGRDKRTVISLSGGRVTAASNTPNVSKGDDWIEPTPAQLSGVLDPIGAMLIPAPSLRQVCARTISTFSGALRADLKMSYLRTIPFSAKGFSGDAVTCRAQFLPIAGFNRSKREINWMRDKGRIEISFAPVGQTGLYAPVKARVKIDGATVNVTATRFEQLTN
ncbi:MAG: DUF3108 domain-containing protein [Roseitalea sp.]|jgi:hypothetical protein|nr:DUF3108 domain-containing protein [Roseitalea sp.]MBO6720940.1 DUF3108 domain-containing protein [Roseitalea sp.]MBO6743245.1 DUF3108 domain-containing protein [Roseitalea sp.]